MILGFEISQIRLKLQVTAWCAIKLKDSRSTGLTQLLRTISAQPRLLCASVSLLIKNKLYPKSMTTHTFSKHKESPKNTLNQGRHVQMSYREGFIDLIVVNLWLLNACFGNGLGDYTGASDIFSLSPLHSPPAVSWNLCYQNPHLSGLNVIIGSQFHLELQKHCKHIRLSHIFPHLIEKHKNNEDLNHMVQRQHLKNT